MKKILPLSFILFLQIIPIWTYAGDDEKLIPSYEITKNEEDNSLTNKEALFVFTFKNIPWPARIQGSCNGLQKTVMTTSKGEHVLKTIPGKYIFQFYYSEEFFEIYTDSIEIKPGYKIEININFESSIYPVMSEKPVIYVYPNKTTKVNIQLDVKGEFTFTYPPYNNGWDLMADPNGTLHINNKEYQYLFWDGNTNINVAKINWSEGFVVNKNELLSFLENKLFKMGLNSKESQDYITYWYPLMSKNENNYIHFLFNEEYDEYAHITVDPKPNSMFRVYMMWVNAEDMGEVQLTEQIIPSFDRNGFTVVEWGGAQLHQMPKLGL